MIKVVLVDDQMACIKDLLVHLEIHEDIEVVGSYTDGIELLSVVDNLDVDLAFLDIEMPKIMGYDLAKVLIEKGIEVIFVTAYKDYILAALRMSAFDFLLKPVEASELTRSLSRLKERLSRKQKQELAEVLKSHIEKTSEVNTKIVISTADSYEVVRLESILYCKSENNYTWFYFSDGTKTLTSMSLKYIEQDLVGKGFIRVHQSYLVNGKHIKKFIKADGGSVVLSDGTTVHVSRRLKHRVLEHFEQHKLK